MTENESTWIQEQIEKTVQKHGSVPPLWSAFPNKHPYSAFWRMGAGESYSMIFNKWWENQQFDEATKIDYFRKWPPPPRWLESMLTYVWDILPEGEELEDYSLYIDCLTPYFDRLESLGFGSKIDYENDIANPKWLNT